MNKFYIDDTMYELMSFASRGKIRRKVLVELVEPNTPTILSRLMKTHRSTVSRTIIELGEKKGLLNA